MLQLDEPINVWVFFKGTSVQPHIFFWKNRRIKVDKINLIHTSKEGSSVFYHFSISSGGNYYELKFDQKELKWVLEAVEEE